MIEALQTIYGIFSNIAEICGWIMGVWALFERRAVQGFIMRRAKDVAEAVSGRSKNAANPREPLRSPQV